MSDDRSIGGLKGLAGNSDLSQTARMRALSPEAVGKAEAETGNPLPVNGASSSPDPEAIARKLETASLNIGHDLRFIVDLERGQPIIQVVDSETGEVIRQIPVESAVNFSLDDDDAGFRLLDTLA
jgi:uncharacterized FlaG/YvyC family protein